MTPHETAEVILSIGKSGGDDMWQASALEVFSRSLMSDHAASKVSAGVLFSNISTMTT